MEHRRGYLLMGFLFVVGVLVGIGALALYLSNRDAELRANLESVTQSLVELENHRKELSARVDRALDLYSLVGTELSSQNEELSVLVARGLGAKEQEIRRMRDSIAEQEIRLTESAKALKSEIETQSVGLASVKDDLHGMADRLRSIADSLDSLDQRFRTSSEEIRSQIEAIPRIKEVRDSEAHQLIDNTIRRIEAIEGQLGTDLSWLQGEVRRINGRIDDLGHTVRRLETRQGP